MQLQERGESRGGGGGGRCVQIVEHNYINPCQANTHTRARVCVCVCVPLELITALLSRNPQGAELYRDAERSGRAGRREEEEGRASCHHALTRRRLVEHFRSAEREREREKMSAAVTVTGRCGPVYAMCRPRCRHSPEGPTGILMSCLSLS